MTGRVVVRRSIGVDPGPTPGLVALDLFADGSIAERHVVQCSAGIALDIFRTLLELDDCPVAIQIERFVVGARAGRSSNAAAGRRTRELVIELEVMAARSGQDRLLFERSAVEVKPWASDARLRAAGLFETTAGMPHARDAARHALYVGVNGGICTDPLSKGARK